MPIFRSTSFMLPLIILLFLVACTAEPQQEDMPTLQAIESPNVTYQLDWNVTEPIAYRTAMNVIDQADLSYNDLFEGLQKAFGVETDDVKDLEFDEITSALDQLKLPEVTSIISILEPVSGGEISVKMILGEVTIPDSNTGTDSEMADSINEMFTAAFSEGSVQLRGSLNPEGEITSFYLESRQKNLLAIFFELPVGEVQVGDTWKLDFNCISMGYGFIVDDAEKTNLVRFSDVTETSDGRTIAVLDYMLFEQVAGSMQSFTSEMIPASMTCSYFGRGEFLIDEGRWYTMTGEMSISSTGFMNSNAIQQLSLLPLETIPEEYIGVE